MKIAVGGARSDSKGRLSRPLSRSLSGWPKQKMASPSDFERAKPLKVLRWLPPGKLRSEMFYVASITSICSKQPLSLLYLLSLNHR